MSNFIIINGELYHAGVKGMKWGRRKARPQAGAGSTNARDVEAQRRARVKKGVAIGTAVVGTALAAYGAYKVHKFVKDTHVKIEAERGYDLGKDAYQNMKKRALNKGGPVKVVSEANRWAKDYADLASKDSFGTAARNVINYKRSGGDLKGLKSVSQLTNLPLEFVHKGRR